MNIYGITTARTAAKAATNGIGGLATGLDTDGLVKAFTAATRAKIDKQVQAKQTTGWRMDAYREVTSKLNSFADKYTSFTSSTNLMSKGFYSTSSVKANGASAEGMTATGSLDKNKNLSILALTEKAAAASYSSKEVVSNTITTGELGFGAAAKTLQTIAGQTINIEFAGEKFDLKIADDFEYTGAESVKAALDAAIGEQKLETGESLKDKIEVVLGEVGENGKSISFRVRDTETETESEIPGGDGGDESEGTEGPAAPELLKIIGASGAKTLSALGLKTGASTDGVIVGGEIKEDAMTTKLNFNETIAGKSMTFTYNGTSKTISFGDESDFTSIDDFKDHLNTELKRLFGEGKVVAETTGENNDKLSFKTGGTGTLNTLSVTVNGTNMSGEDGLLGMPAESSNRADLKTAIKDLNFNFGELLSDNGEPGKYTISVNGTDVEITGDMTLGDMINKINESDSGLTVNYNSTTNRFQVTANETGAHGKVEIADKNGGNLALVMFGIDEGSKIVGSDAKMIVSYDGGKTAHEIERSTNIFEFDGLTINTNGMKTFTTEKSGDPGVYDVNGAVTFTANLNTDNIVDAIKSMINDYNELSSFLKSQTSTRHDRSFTPLTDEQRAELSESEIKNWEEKAKTGLLYNDTNLRALENELRFVFSFGVEGVGSFSEIGISTGSFLDGGSDAIGKIKLDEDKLRAALQGDPDKVMKLFTAAGEKTAESESGGGIKLSDPNGLMTRLKGITDKYASKVGATKGILVELAGVEGSDYITINSRMYKQLADIDKLIEGLNKKLTAEETRHYRKFTSLEKYTANMNSLGSFITDMNG